MRRLKTEKSQKGKRNAEMFEALSKSELNFIRGGDQANSEKRDDQ